MRTRERYLNAGPTSAKAEKAFALFHEGRLRKAVETLTAGRGGPSKLPLDFFDIFFPSDDCRQDLINWLIVFEKRLEPHESIYAQARRALTQALGTPEPEGEGAALMAFCEVMRLDYDAGLRHMERAARTARPSFWLHLFHASCLWLKTWQTKSRDLFPRALGAVERAIALDGKKPFAFMMRAGIKRELEDLEGHLADAGRALKLKPDFIWALAEKAENLGEGGHYRSALSALNRLLALRGKDAWIWVHRARLRVFHGFYDKAMADFQTAVKLDPECGPIYAWRGEARRRLGDYAGALEDFDRAIALDGSYRFPHHWKGRILLMRGDYQGAVAAFTRTLELEPREQLAAIWRAEAWWKMGRCQDAALGFDSVFPAEPHMAWNRLIRDNEAQELQFFMGKKEAAAKRDEAFWSDLDAVAAAHPRDPWAWAFRGRCRVARGALNEGLADLSRSIELEPKNAYARRWRGEGLRRLGDIPAAIDDLSEALRLEPADAWAAAYRALAQAARGSDSLAEADFARALPQREQRFAVLFLWRGEWRHARGRLDDARKDIQAAFTLDGKDPRVLSWRRRLGLNRKQP